MEPMYNKEDTSSSVSAAGSVNHAATLIQWGDLSDEELNAASASPAIKGAPAEDAVPVSFRADQRAEEPKVQFGARVDRAHDWPDAAAHDAALALNSIPVQILD